jgi:polyhydroxyalkanoate synthesis regulator phasin
VTVGTVRASLGRMQSEGERMVAGLRRDAEAFVARSRGEVTKEVRGIERRVLKALHAATQEHVTRLERRIAHLEQMVRELHEPSGTGGEKAA